MNTAEYVSKLISDGKATGMDRQELAWKAGLACVGWAYVFGARGEYCTPANRRARYSADHPTIKSACKNYNGSGSSGCKGCKWYPSEKYTRFFDCRGYTYWILKQVYDGWELMGSGATSQWNTTSNWTAKGTIDTVPNDKLVCLFVKKGSTMEHTGFGFRGETLECSSGVQHFTNRNKKWTHWGLPKCVSSEPPKPEPIPEGYAVVTGKKVALRKDPSLQAIIITRVDTGEKVKIEPNPPKEWDYVSYGGKVGWMKREFLREDGNKAVVTGKRVALRKDPSLRATIIMRVNTGEIVKLEKEPQSEWSYVSYGKDIGYMMTQYLRM